MEEKDLLAVFRCIRAVYRELGPDAEVIVLVKPPDKAAIERHAKENRRLGSRQKSSDAWRKYENWKKTRQDAVPARGEERG